MRLPISPFHGMRSSPGISRPNLTHLTMRTVWVAGCAALPEFLSSAMKASPWNDGAIQDTASGEEIPVGPQWGDCLPANLNETKQFTAETQRAQRTPTAHHD